MQFILLLVVLIYQIDTDNGRVSKKHSNIFVILVVFMVCKCYLITPTSFSLSHSCLIFILSELTD